MPLIKPVKGSYFLKPLQPPLYRAAVSLECFSCEHFWNEKDLGDLLKNPRVHALMATRAMTPVGYVVFEKLKKERVVQILNLVVHPDHRRNKIGTIFVDRIVSRFEISCDSVIMNVRESNLAAHLFLQSLDFVAEKVERGHFQDHWAEDTDIEDAYCFRKNL